MTIQQPEGLSWSERASLPGLAPVLDPRDSTGAKNRAIDRVHKAAIARFAGDLRGRKVLDFGCGTGRLSEWLLSQGALVDALDVTPEMIEVARQHAPGARFIISNGRIPGPANTYDVIVSAYVLQYYVADTDALHRILGDFVRVLRPGGRLLAIEQVTDGDLTHMMPADHGAKALASEEAYLRALSRAGLRSLDTKMVRISDSRILHLVTRLGWMSRVPHLPRAFALEARLRAGAPLQGGRYVDVLFKGTRLS